MGKPAVAAEIYTEWLTPPEFVEHLRAWDPIALDPCACRGQFVEARKKLYRRGDAVFGGGLVADWKRIAGCRLVYVNPPWNNSSVILTAWSGKILVEAERRCEIIALLPGYTDTGWYQGLFPSSAAVLAWRGRFCFRRHDTKKRAPARFASHLFYFGRHPGKFRRVFADRGVFLR